MIDTPPILAGLRADSAKQRERVIKSLTQAAMQEGQVIEQLQVLVSADPVEYVRQAARAQLIAAGQTPRESLVPPQLTESNTNNVPVIAFVVGIPVLLICVSIFVIATLAILGPQIGNIFSRVTNGLAR